MDLLRVGIIGLGVGEKHVNAYKNNPNCVVHTICDFNENKLNTVGANYNNVKLTTDSEEVLKDSSIDVISIASYDKYHAYQILNSIENNKHVFVEKPICLNLEEAINIAKALKKKPNLKLSSNLILRKSPRFLDLKNKISENILGDVFAIEAEYLYGKIEKIISGWRNKFGYYSVFLGGGIHLVDLICWITESQVIEVFATGNDIGTRGTSFKYNDYVIATLKLKNGIVAKVSANFACVHPHFHSFSVYGNKGTFINGQNNAKLITNRKYDEYSVNINSEYPGYEKGMLIDSFINEIIGFGRMEVTTKEIFETILVCFAVEESLKLNKPVLVKNLKDLCVNNENTVC